MKTLPIHIVIDSELYLKDPNTSALGKKIVSHSIDLINELGFEGFTFKKLGEAIGSNESSIYRYFENKHMLLVYLLCWYWSWVEYRLVFETNNVSDDTERLKKAIILLTEKVTEDVAVSYINEQSLERLVIAESSKAYHTKEIDEENQKGYFKVYKRIIHRISEMIQLVNPSFAYPNMLASTVIEGAQIQRFFVKHLPSLTDTSPDEDSIVSFYTDMVIKNIHSTN